HPASSDERDVAAARRADGYLNRWFLDPLHGRGYPADMVETYGKLLDQSCAAELAGWNGGLDFLGVNYYTRRLVRASDAPPLRLANVNVSAAQHTEMGWEVYPDGLREILGRVHADYQPAVLMVTENGAAFDDVVTPLGEIDDEPRRSYLGRRSASRILRVVLDGQLRVGPRLQQAIRPLSRRLRNSAAHIEEERRLVSLAGPGALRPSRSAAMNEMRAVVIESPGVARLSRLSVPEPGPGEVLVSVAAAGICGSDLEILRGTRPAPYVRYPVVPGHEWAGAVAAVGAGVSGIGIGDRVVAEGFRSCGV